MNEFALTLYQRLPAGGNLVWSPYSVAAALALAAAGARGATRDELTKALGTTDSLAPSAVLSDAEIAVANSLWIRAGLPVRDEYATAALQLAGGAVHTADFVADADGARQAINAEVAKTTKDLIKDLLAPGTITNGTVAVLASALYLKVAWLRPFVVKATSAMPFSSPAGRIRVPTMRQTERMSHAEADGWAMVTVPTRSEVVVDLLLPGATPLTAELYDRLRDSGQNRSVELWVPKFRLEYETNLRGPLTELGVRTAFTDQADLSGITPEPLRLDEAAHKAVLRVDEQGFEGAAATALTMRMAAMTPSTPTIFKADRPFLAVVRHGETGAVYFLARVERP